MLMSVDKVVIKHQENNIGVQLATKNQPSIIVMVGFLIAESNRLTELIFKDQVGNIYYSKQFLQYTNLPITHFHVQP
jgi:hypothetical protein